MVEKFAREVGKEGDSVVWGVWGEVEVGGGFFFCSFFGDSRGCGIGYFSFYLA